MVGYSIQQNHSPFYTHTGSTRWIDFHFGHEQLDRANPKKRKICRWYENLVRPCMACTVMAGIFATSLSLRRNTSSRCSWVSIRTRGDITIGNRSLRLMYNRWKRSQARSFQNLHGDEFPLLEESVQSIAGRFPVCRLLPQAVFSLLANTQSVAVVVHQSIHQSIHPSIYPSW